MVVLYNITHFCQDKAKFRNHYLRSSDSVSTITILTKYLIWILAAVNYYLVSLLPYDLFSTVKQLRIFVLLR